MKNLIVLLFFILPISMQGQWNIKYIPADDFSSLEVIGVDTVVTATRGGGRIHRSFDGAQTWGFDQTIFTTSWFNDMHFPSKNVGYACGGTAFGWHTNIISKTVDGGLTWDSLTSNSFSGYEFQTLFFPTESIGFIAPGPGTVLKTVNGGFSFTPVTIPNAVSVSEIYFPNLSNGLFCSFKVIAPNTYVYNIHRTTDLGITWAEVYADTVANVSGINDRRINKVFFLDNNNGYAVGGNGLFLKTTDGGLSWIKSFISPYNNLTALHFTDVNTGYTNNAGGIYKTTDGGITWNAQQINWLSIIYDIKFANDSVGYAIGEHGVYKTTNGGVFTGIKDIDGSSGISIFPNPSSTSISVESNSLIFKKVHIYNLNGQLVLKEFSDFDKIDISALSKGIYTVSVFTKKNRFSKKLIKE